MDTLLERFNSGSYLYFEKYIGDYGEESFCVSTEGEGNEMHFGPEEEKVATDYVHSIIGKIPTNMEVMDLSHKYSVSGIRVGKWKWKIRYMRVNPKGWQTVQI